MLRKFKVSNFKNFEKEFVFDLTETNGYAFNKECIKDGTANCALVYGRNGVGKSNLALAIFDIIGHLTDKQKNIIAYQNYLNANSELEFAEFYYEFFINSKVVVYEYKKSNYNTIIYERFSIDDEVLAFFDRSKGPYFTTHFKGAETLKTEINNSELSVLKYIINNTELTANPINFTFVDFFTYVNKMLFFRSLKQFEHLGLQDSRRRNIFEDIIERNNVEDFQNFLNKAGVDCKLAVVEELDKKTIAFNFGKKNLPFDIASTGTISLTLFYYWFQSIREESEVSFLFIDEFDAFFHHELSKLIVEELKKTGVQFVLTTHNTSIMTNDLLRPDCYFTMNKKSIQSFSKGTEKELREAHNIEKMYKAGTFNV
jgi:AAA15 family ATPase/GTPase